MFDLSKVPNPKGHVELLEIIGKGNFGYVYKGRMTATKEIAAVKVVQLKEEEMREILLEVEILQDCSHSNITRFMGKFVRNEDLWICMEFCGGGAADSVYRHLKRQLSEEEVGVLIHEGLKGLQYLHDKRIIHRDIKSGNLLVTESGEVKLADFGVSAVTNERNGYRAHSFIGTPYWMAPEVIMSENSADQLYDAKADIWSIGITVIELADKNPPLSEIHPMRALHLIPTANPQVLMVKNPKKWTKPFVEFIQNCLIKDPKARPSSKQILEHPYMKRIASLGPQGIQNTVCQLLADSKNEKVKLATMKRPNPVEANESDEEDAEFTGFDQKQPRNPPEQQKQPKSQQQEDKQAAAVSSQQSQKSAVGDSSKGPSLLTVLKPGNLFGAIRRQLSSSRLDADDEWIDVDPTADAQNEISDITALVQEVLANPDKFRAKSTESIFQHNQPPLNRPIPDSVVYDLVPLDLCLRTDEPCSDSISVEVRLEDGKTTLRHYLLTGTDSGLYATDITHHNDGKQNARTLYQYEDGGRRTRQLIRFTRFRQIQVLEDYGVLIALCGKFNHIREYRLKSLRKLISHVFSIKPAVALKSNLAGSDDLLALIPQHSSFDRNDPVYYVNDYTKILNSRDSRSFIVSRTSQTIYVGVMFKNSIIIYEWAKLPYLRFLKVKEFWLPEMPKFFEICHDGLVIRELHVVYEKETNRIEFESSKVIEVEVKAQFKSILAKEVTKDKDQARWKSWIQLHLLTQADTQENNGPAKTWYHTIKQMKPQQNANSNPVPPAHSHYLVTYGNYSYHTDVNGQPHPQPTAPQPIKSSFQWGRVPPNMFFGRKASEPMLGASAPKRVIAITPKLLLGVHDNYIEVVHYETGQLLQVIRCAGALKMLVPTAASNLANRRRGRIYVASVNSKQKLCTIFWLRERNFDNYRYEAERSQRDLKDRAAKVIGTGALVHI